MTAREQLIETIHAMPAPKALEGLPVEDAERKLDWPGGAHSIAEITAHMAFWQEWFLGRARGSGEPAAEHAELGWPPVESGGWPQVLKRFLDGLEQASGLDASSDALADPPFEAPMSSEYTIGDIVQHISLHNAHHLGQIISLRQAMGLWPPPSGRFTW